jgi:hypothetical protein
VFDVFWCVDAKLLQTINNGRGGVDAEGCCFADVDFQATD